MHSLRASILFLVIALCAFFGDHRRQQPSVSPGPARFVSADDAVDSPVTYVPDLVSAEEERPTKRRPTKVTRIVRVTAYNAVPEQTDETPDICAWGDQIRPGIIAISRDLEQVGLTRGKEVYIEGIGKAVVLDRMHDRKRNQIDIYMQRYEDAVRFGAKELSISWLEDAHSEQDG
jgi:3D (Asp-Asp-Asp) domain-containing protein